MSNDPHNMLSFPLSGIGFEHGKARPSQDSVEALEGHMLEKIKNSKTDIHVWGYASEPGSEAVNQSLTDKRCQWGADWLISHGVSPDRIKVHSMGEHAPVTRMAEANEVDKADDRVLIFDFEPDRPVEVPTELQTGFANRKGTVDDLNDGGRETFFDEADPFADFVQRHVPTPDNPILANPTGSNWKNAIAFMSFLGMPDDIDKIEAGGGAALKGGGSAKDFLMPGYNKIGKFFLGSMINLANAGQASETKNSRKPLFEALAAGMAAGFDEDYRPDGFGDYSSLQLQLFEDAKAAFDALPLNKKVESAIYLIKEAKGMVADGFSAAQWKEVLKDLGPIVFKGAMGRFDYNNFSTNSSDTDEGEYEPLERDQSASEESDPQDSQGAAAPEETDAQNATPAASMADPMLRSPTEPEDGMPLNQSMQQHVQLAHGGMSLLQDAGENVSFTSQMDTGGPVSHFGDATDNIQPADPGHFDVDQGMCLSSDLPMHDVDASAMAPMVIPGANIPHSGANAPTVLPGSSAHNHTHQTALDAGVGHAPNQGAGDATQGHTADGSGSAGLTHADGGMDTINQADVIPSTHST